MKILGNAKRDGLDVPVVPMALTNFWGSFFSCVEKGHAMVKPFRGGVLSRVGLNVGQPLKMSELDPEALRSRVAVLLR